MMGRGGWDELGEIAWLDCRGHTPTFNVLKMLNKSAILTVMAMMTMMIMMMTMMPTTNHNPNLKILYDEVHHLAAANLELLAIHL